MGGQHDRNHGDNHGDYYGRGQYDDHFSFREALNTATVMFKRSTNAPRRRVQSAAELDAISKYSTSRTNVTFPDVAVTKPETNVTLAQANVT